ncbi:glycosyltransferase family 2 protein [Alicyclobacillus macrosporangiidus]|uniref:glycosyltransferase family 2 protein n=1 Tax=Alicyclobacillus macrosporangiidus TaxID=392015 RepID=UPI0009DF4DD7
MISVVIVTYNSIQVLPDCLKSLEETSVSLGLEVILVDNCSSDGTWDWLIQYQNSKPRLGRVKLIRLHENRGYSYANNRGAEIASGEILLLLNPDTIVGEKTIEICAESLLDDASIGAVGCRLLLPNGKLDKACRRSLPTLWNSFTRLSGLSMIFPKSHLFSRYNLTYLDQIGNYEVECICGAFFMIRKSTYELLHGLDEDYFMYGEDVDLCYRLRRAGYRIYYLGDAVTIHLKGANGGKRSALSLQHFYRTMLVYYDKHYSMKYPRLLRSLLSLVVRSMFIFHVTWINVRQNASRVLKLFVFTSKDHNVKPSHIR